MISKYGSRKQTPSESDIRVETKLKTTSIEIGCSRSFCFFKISRHPCFLPRVLAKRWNLLHVTLSAVAARGFSKRSLMSVGPPRDWSFSFYLTQGLKIIEFSLGFYAFLGVATVDSYHCATVRRKNSQRA